MERAGGTEADSVIDDLTVHGHRFEFFQAVSLLHLALAQADGEPVPGKAPFGGLRFRAAPTLGFPATDVTGVSVARDEHGRPVYEMEVTFLGLYGPSSPLPAFVTERVIARDRDTTALRDFLDLFNHRAIEILYAIWRKYRHAVTYRRGAADPISGYVIALMGMLGLRTASNPPLSLESLLPFAGPFGLPGHSAMLVETLVSRQLGGVPARVEEFVPRRAVVEEAQRCRLGIDNSILGADWVLGARVPDVMGKFRLWIGPLDIEDYRALLPGRPGRRRLESLVEMTVRPSLQYDIVLVVRDEDIPPWRLGQPVAFGYDAWLAGGGRVENAVAMAA